MSIMEESVKLESQINRKGMSDIYDKVVELGKGSQDLKKATMSMNEEMTTANIDTSDRINLIEDKIESIEQTIHSACEDI